MTILPIYPFYCRTFVLFPVLIIMDTAAVNIFCYLHVCISFGCISRNGIAGSESMVSFYRFCQPVF